jgi:gliding motility-associated-like protein
MGEGGVLLQFNPNLSCVQVDNKAYSDANWSTRKDATTSFSEDCSKIAAIAPPIITATGNQTYCPGTSLPIVENISITNDPTEPSTDAIYIQISAGYIIGQDQLILANAGLHSSITTSWDANAGKLKLYSPSGAKILYKDFETAIKDVQFSSFSATASGIRSFSITIGQANYLPRNKHFYRYISSPGIYWKDAKIEAESQAKYYYGLHGYLATLTSADEAQLSGTQALGTGWIGGSDETEEGTWKWVTGPEGLENGGTGTVFWYGTNSGYSPSPINFAFWNNNEPNDSNGSLNGIGEDYAHITNPNLSGAIRGSWNDLPNTGGSGLYAPQGYIVEYGGIIPGDVDDIHISASTSLTIAKITTTTPNVTICETSTTMLQASSTTGVINWYDAATGGNLLKNNSSNYTTPPLSTTTTFFVDNGCSVRTPITVTVEPLPSANIVTIPRKCDDNQDGIVTFDTSNLESNLLNGQSLSNVSVSYFDQNNATLPSPFPASFTTKSQIIKAVITNKTSLKCSAATNIQFIVDVLPQAFSVPASLTTTCDDEPNPINQDGKFAFDTSTFESILLGTQSGMEVTYTLQNGTILSTLSPTFVTGTQDVLVTVTNPSNTNCTATTTLHFVVNPLPIVKDVTIIQCDSDLVPDGKTFFNLTVKNDQISTNYINEDFTFYTSQSGANIGILSPDLILNELAFENTTASIMEVWTRVTNKITGCFSVAKLILKVPATNLLSTYKIEVPPVCDDFIDSNNDNRDGISTFDFYWTKAKILEQLANQNYTINYFRNKIDALSQLNPITDISKYRNTGYPNSQDIWVRVESSIDNACVGLGPYITLKVEALPFANSVNIPRKCDDNQDGIVTFDTSNLESTLIGTNQFYPIIVKYFDQNNNPLPSPFPASFTTKSQVIKAVVTNNTTLKCYDETKIQFIVDVLPQAFPVASSLTTVCDDELDPLNQDGKYAFDTSTFEATILGGQTGKTVKYIDGNGNQLPSPLPNPFKTGTQNVVATVLNPANTSCTSTTQLNFVVNPLPKINLNTNGNENKLVCSNDPTFSVLLDAGIQDNSSPNDYTYTWSKDGIILGKKPELSVNKKGTYTLEVKNSFDCSRLRNITVNASDIAKIDTIEIIDMTDVNTVTVNVTGPGKYEYSLDDPGFWQDSNFFANVPSGIHDVYINDKNGCGYVSKTIAVIGAPKFFTPNNDGYNDYWSIKGVNETFNSKSIIYIFDRYGKLIKQWAPYLNQGWDGTYNGSPLPADDYWFTLKLEDGREANGHFSLKR